MWVGGSFREASNLKDREFESGRHEGLEVAHSEGGLGSHLFNLR
jgi:hypothetical protein